MMPRTNLAGMRRTLLHQLPLLVWLVVLWMLLWGSASWLNLLTGIIVAVAVTRIFFLPPVEFSGRFNLWWAIVFIVTFFGDVATGSIHVANLAINPRRLPHSSVIAVKLHTNSDLIMLLVSINISLVPGSLVVEADRFHSMLYVHALDTRDDADVERFRQTVLKAERRIVRVIGSREDLVTCEASRRQS